MLPVSSASASITGCSSSVVARRSPGGWRGGAVERLRGGSVLGLDGPVEVGAHQDREDVGLQEDDQQLEERHHDRHQRRDRSEYYREVVAAEQVHRTQGEDHQQHGAGEHVGEEPDREGERPDDEVLQDLDRGHQDVHELRDARQEEDVLEVAADTLLADPDVDVEDPADQREDEREGELRHRRDLREGDDRQQVVRQDEEEQRREERRERQSSRSHHVAGDAAADEGVAALPDELQLAGHDLRLAHGRDEEGQHL